MRQLEQEISQRFGLRYEERWGRNLTTALNILSERHSLSEADHCTILADPHLLRELAGLLTVEETFFFRFPEQFADAMHHLGTRRWDTRDPNLVLWSAGCSTGEEAYSLAIHLRDSFGPRASRCRVLACDINADAIIRAQRGVYGNWSFRGVTAAAKERCFVPVKDGLEIKNEYRQSVHFEHQSIRETAANLAESSVEVVFFRNVGVYLNKPALEACYAAFERVLSPTGLLVQAATDPAPPTETFVRQDRFSVGVYQPRLKPPKDDRAPPPPRPPSLRPPHALPKTLPPPPHVEALALGDRGQLDQAIAAAQRAVEAKPTDSAGFLVRGQLCLAADRAEEAVNDLRRALFIAPASRLARYWYILALRASQQSERAEGQLRELSRQLSGQPDDEVLEDGATRVGELREAIATLEAFYD